LISEKTRIRKRKIRVPGDSHISNLTSMPRVCLDVETIVRIPEPKGAVLATAQTVFSIMVESHCQHCPFMASQHSCLLGRKCHTRTHDSCCVSRMRMSEENSF
jgi:hypothetical protein